MRRSMTTVSGVAHGVGFFGRTAVSTMTTRCVYIDFAAAMGYEYALIDNWWDTNIGRERMKSLIDYARGKGVELFLWYSSSGYWNDIEQGPINHMDNAIIRQT